MFGSLLYFLNSASLFDSVLTWPWIVAASWLVILTILNIGIYWQLTKIKKYWVPETKESKKKKK